MGYGYEAMSYRETEHLRVLIANERKDRLALVAPIVAKVMQATISRRREVLADVSGVALTRYPPGLISALEKLRDDTTVVHSSSRATAHLWVESPLARTPEEGRLSRLNRMFDTHPPLEERIQALKEL